MELTGHVTEDGTRVAATHVYHGGATTPQTLYDIAPLTKKERPRSRRLGLRSFTGTSSSNPRFPPSSMQHISCRLGVSLRSHASGRSPSTGRARVDDEVDDNDGENGGRPTGTQRAKANKQARAEQHQACAAVAGYREAISFVSSKVNTNAAVQESAGVRVARRALERKS